VRAGWWWRKSVTASTLLKRRSRSVWVCDIVSTLSFCPIEFRREAPCVVVCWCGGRYGRVLADWWWRLVSCAVDHVEASLKKCVWYRVHAVFLPDLVRRLAQCVVVSLCGGCRRALTGWW